MSCNDRNAGVVRPWRQLTRVLVVAGATVAGTSTAWLVGQALPADAAATGAVSGAVHQNSTHQQASGEQGLRELVPGGEQFAADAAGELPSPADVPAVTGAIVDPVRNDENPVGESPDAEPADSGSPDADSLRLEVPPTTPGQEATPLLATSTSDSDGLDVQLADGALARAELSPSAPPGLEVAGRTVLPNPAGPGERPAAGDPVDADPVEQSTREEPAATDHPVAPEPANVAAQTGSARTGFEQACPQCADFTLAGPGSVPRPLVSTPDEDAQPDPGSHRATTAPRIPAAPQGGCSGPSESGQPSGLDCHFGHAVATLPFASGQVPDRADAVGGPAEPQPGTTPD